MPKEAGRIEVAVGPMFSGKTSWLINHFTTLSIAQRQVLAVRFSKDDRYSTDSITSHNGHKAKAFTASTVEDIASALAEMPHTQDILIDEVQFYEPELARFTQDLQRRGLNVFASGLDLDFKNDPWPTTSLMLSVASSVQKLIAVCNVCNRINANRTQRLIDGMPASRQSPQVLIGGSESYTARCVECHELPD